MAKPTSRVFILFSALCLIQFVQAIQPFTQDSILVSIPGGIQEMDISGYVFQTISIPDGYSCPSCILHLDATGTQIILPLSTGAAGDYNLFAYTINSNGDFVDRTSVTSTSPIRDAVIKDKDVWINYFDGVAHVTRGSLGASSATSANILTNADPQIKSIQYDDNSNQLGYLYGGSNNVALTNASTGPYSLNSIASSPAFWLDHPNLYIMTGATMMGKFTWNNDNGVYTKVYEGDTGLPVVYMTGMKINGKTYIIYITPGNYVKYMVDLGYQIAGAISIISSQGTYYSVVASPKVTCSDNLQNQDETDVDCGGATCAARCIADKKCTGNSDCVSNVCDAGLCVATCNDGLQNQDETDIDCGGSNCTACVDGKMCTKASDCSSNYCNPNNNCSTPTCSDGFQNFGESDVDCGGNNCAPCSLGNKCTQNSDCSTSTCAANVCVNAPVAAPVTPIAAPVAGAPSAGPQSNNSPGGSSPASSTPISRKVSSSIAMECSLVIGLIVGSFVLIF